MSNDVNTIILESHYEECEGITGQACAHTPEEIIAMYEGPTLEEEIL